MKSKKSRFSKDRPEATHSSVPLESLVQALKSRRLKVTVPRKLILGALRLGCSPLSAQEIHERHLKDRCDLVTVYRNLTSLEAGGILSRCEFGDGVSRYELNVSGEHHHHLICQDCRSVDVIDLGEIESQLNQIVTRRGFQLPSHTLELFGICPKCRVVE